MVVMVADWLVAAKCAHCVRRNLKVEEMRPRVEE